MRITGSAEVGAPIKRVWDALQDRDLLAGAIPGCSGLQTAGEGVYTFTVTARVASVDGPLTGKVRVSEQRPPYAFAATASAQGPPGGVDAAVEITLREVDSEHTRVDYDADASVDGEIACVGQLLLVGQAKRTAGEFFGAVERALTGVPEPRAERVEASPMAELAGLASDAVRTRLGSAAATDPRLAFAGGLAVGAGVALAAARLARRGRSHFA